MKMRKQFLNKIIITVVLLLLSALITATIHAVLASRSPLNALPSMSVSSNNSPLPAQHAMISSYSWRFLFITKQGVEGPADAWQYLPAAPVNAMAPLAVEFSFPCDEVHISVARGDSTDFVEVGGVLHTPPDPGKYTYRVEASWGIRGSVLYYFKIAVGGFE